MLAFRAGNSVRCARRPSCERAPTTGSSLEIAGLIMGVCCIENSIILGLERIQYELSTLLIARKIMPLVPHDIAMQSPTPHVACSVPLLTRTMSLISAKPAGRYGPSMWRSGAGNDAEQAWSVPAEAKVAQRPSPLVHVRSLRVLARWCCTRFNHSESTIRAGIASSSASGRRQRVLLVRAMTMCGRCAPKSIRLMDPRSANSANGAAILARDPDRTHRQRSDLATTRRAATGRSR